MLPLVNTLIAASFLQAPGSATAVATTDPAAQAPVPMAPKAAPWTLSTWLDSLHLTPEGAMSVALIVLSVTALVAVATAFYLYRWRRLALDKPHLLSPEHLAAHVLSLEDRIAESERAQAQTTARLEAASGEMRKALERMIETHMALQPKLDERDREIQRLRAGFEASLFKRFVRRFVRADLSLAERIRAGAAGPESLHSLSALLEDALAECGVERFTPPVGIDYRRAEGVADNPELIPTTDESLAFHIAEVRRPGYRFTEGAGDGIVMPAEVAVYEFRHVSTPDAGDKQWAH